MTGIPACPWQAVDLRPCRVTQTSPATATSGMPNADLVLDGAGDALSEVLYLGQLWSLHHHASQRFGSGEPDQNAAGRAHGFFARADLMLHGQHLGERFLLAHAHVVKPLRID